MIRNITILKVTFFIFLFCFGYSQDLVITEIKPKGKPEWIELYNRSDESIDLTGYRFVGRNNNGNDKWINFNICNDQYQLSESCGGDGTDCLLAPDKFLVIYEGAGLIGEDWGGMAGNPECYIDQDTRPVKLF